MASGLRFNYNPAARWDYEQLSAGYWEGGLMDGIRAHKTLSSQPGSKGHAIHLALHTLGLNS